MALARQGMSASERRDVEGLLDDAQVSLSPEARGLLCEVVGRQPPTPPAPPPPPPSTGVRFQYQNSGFGPQITGAAAPNADVFIINAARYNAKNMLDVRARADANGRFTIDLPTDGLNRYDWHHGDAMLGWTVSNGVKSDVKTFAMGRPEADTTAPGLSLSNVSLIPGANNMVEVSKKSDGARFGEPNSWVHFIHSRTLAETSVQLTALGELPSGHLSLQGQAGDTFTIKSSNGTHATRGTVGDMLVSTQGSGPTPFVSTLDQRALDRTWQDLWLMFSPAPPFSNQAPSSDFGVQRTTISGFRSRFPAFVTSDGRSALSDGQLQCDKLLALVDLAERFRTPGYRPTREDRALLG